MKKILCTVRYFDQIKRASIPTDQDLMRSLRKAKIPIPNSCGGEGICTTCKITLVQGELSPPTKVESERIIERNFDENERLSCQCRPLTDQLKIKFP